jgi:hypothetical protein
LNLELSCAALGGMVFLSFRPGREKEQQKSCQSCLSCLID